MSRGKGRGEHVYVIEEGVSAVLGRGRGVHVEEEMCVFLAGERERPYFTCVEEAREVNMFVQGRRGARVLAVLRERSNSLMYLCWSL